MKAFLGFPKNWEVVEDGFEEPTITMNWSNG